MLAIVAMFILGGYYGLTHPFGESDTDRTLAYIKECRTNEAKLGKALNEDFLTTLSKKE